MTTPPNNLRVDRLSLRNFQCLQCTIALHPQLTVLVAKRSRQDRSARCYRHRARPVRGHHRWYTAVAWLITDVRLVQETVPWAPSPGRICRGQLRRRASNALESRPQGYSRRARTTRKLKVCATRHNSFVGVEGDATDGANSPPILPLVAFYGTGRCGVSTG
jgi:hypothetical protein